MNYNIETEHIIIYPNPLRNYLYFYFTGNSKTAIFELYNMQGCQLISKTITDNEKLNLADLNSGIYLYNLYIDGNMQSGKLRKE